MNLVSPTGGRMTVGVRALVGIGFFALLTTWTAEGFAQESPTEPPSTSEPSEESSENAAPSPARPAAPDQRTGHVFVGATTSVVGATGDAALGVPIRDLLATGGSVGGLLGYGLSRHTTIHAFGDYTAFRTAPTCREWDQARGTYVYNCAANSFSFGLGLTYHLAQGLAIDPWASYGFGFRQATIDYAQGKRDPNHPDLTPPPARGAVFQGLDLARIAFGADFYPSPYVGFGLFVEGDFGSFHRRPRATDLPRRREDLPDGSSAYAFFQGGLRIIFDPFGKSSWEGRPRAAKGGPTGLESSGL